MKSHRHWMHNIAFLSFVFVILLSGCANISDHPPYDRNRWGVDYGIIGVAKARFKPAISSELGEGLMAGVAGASFAECMASSGAEFLGLGVAFCSLYAMLNVAPDVVSYAGKEEQVHGKLNPRIETLDFQEFVLNHVLIYAEQHGIQLLRLPPESGPSTPEESPNYASLTTLPVNTIIEVSLLNISAERIGSQIRLNIDGRSRLVRQTDNSIIDSFETKYTSATREVTEWVSNNHELLFQELKEAYRFFAEQTVDEFLLLYYPHGQGTAGTDKHQHWWIPDYVLKPINPTARILKKPFNSAYPNQQITEIDKVRPIFSWEALHQMLEPYGLKIRLSDVTYEIKLYDTIKYPLAYWPGRLLYVRTGLSSPHHQIELPLPCGRYYWTVRASFYLDDHPSVTEWGGIYGDLYKPWVVRRTKRPYYFPRVNPIYMYYAFQVVPGDQKCAE